MSAYNSILVYLGSGGHARPVFREAAHRLGKMIAGAGKTLVYGGMNAGSMFDLAEGALAEGGKVTGVLPTRLKDSERIHNGVSDIHLVDDLWERKQTMFRMADAVIVLPGGYGTLDELFEVLYWAECGLHGKPIMLIDLENYWHPVMNFLESALDAGHMQQRPFDHVLKVRHMDDALDIIDHWRPGRWEGQNRPAALPHFEHEIMARTQTPIIVDTPDLKSCCRLASALALRQLGAHDRPIGLLNKDGAFDGFLEWVANAASEKFITAGCPKLMQVAKTESGLMRKLEKNEKIVIDLHTDKWG